MFGLHQPRMTLKMGDTVQALVSYQSKPLHGSIFISDKTLRKGQCYFPFFFSSEQARLNDNCVSDRRCACLEIYRNNKLL